MADFQHRLVPFGGLGDFKRALQTMVTPTTTFKPPFMRPTPALWMCSLVANSIPSWTCTRTTWRLNMASSLRDTKMQNDSLAPTIPSISHPYSLSQYPCHLEMLLLLTISWPTSCFKSGHKRSTVLQMKLSFVLGSSYLSSSSYAKPRPPSRERLGRLRAGQESQSDSDLDTP